jgi:HAD superfamily hydrolase (TIGR01549 family)
VGALDAVVFDMDGTVLDSSRTVPAAYAAAILELSGRRCSDEEIIGEYGAGPAAALLSRFIGRAATDADVECWIGHLQTLSDRTAVYAGIPEALTRLASAGLRLGIFTGATRRAAELQLAHTDLRGHFEVVVGSDEITSVKPAPDGIFRACELLGVSPMRTAYVGDALNDLLCAQAADAVPVAAAWGHLFDPTAPAQLTAATPQDLLTLLLPSLSGT